MSAPRTLPFRVDPWNLLLAVLTLGVVVYGAVAVPNFLTAFNLSQLSAGVAEKALLVLPMVMLCAHKHGLGACSHQQIDGHGFIAAHVALVVRGITPTTQT